MQRQGHMVSYSRRKTQETTPRPVYQITKGQRSSRIQLRQTKPYRSIKARPCPKIFVWWEMTKRETWEYIKKHMPELAKEIKENQGMFKSVMVKLK